jgi:hypothetical protein
MLVMGKGSNLAFDAVMENYIYHRNTELQLPRN